MPLLQKKDTVEFVGCLLRPSRRIEEQADYWAQAARSDAARKKEAGSIYFGEAHGYIKVGLTIRRSPKKRLHDVPTPNPIVLLRSWRTRDCRWEERSIHAALADFHHNGEWFLLPPIIREKISAWKRPSDVWRCVMEYAKSHEGIVCEDPAAHPDAAKVLVAAGLEQFWRNRNIRRPPAGRQARINAARTVALRRAVAPKDNRKERQLAYAERLQLYAQNRLDLGDYRPGGD